MKIVFRGFPDRPDAEAAVCGIEDWAAGETKDISAEIAKAYRFASPRALVEHLCTIHPDAFEPAASAPAKADPKTAEPPADPAKE